MRQYPPKLADRELFTKAESVKSALDAALVKKNMSRVRGRIIKLDSISQRQRQYLLDGPFVNGRQKLPNTENGVYVNIDRGRHRTTWTFFRVEDAQLALIGCVKQVSSNSQAISADLFNARVRPLLKNYPNKFDLKGE